MTDISQSNDAKRQKKELKAVTNLRDYIKVKTVQPNPDYDGAATFLRRMAEELQLPCKVIELVKGKPIVIMTWEGTKPDLPSIVLNSHIDVVPVFPEHWKYDPFEAFKDEKGDIYGRGTQDMKCVGMQYLEAIRRLKAEVKRYPRTFHVTFVADEEIGGYDGMCLFVKHEEFKKLNVAFALDEGLANPTDAFTVYYGERAPWWVEVTCTGNPGHGSRFIEGDAGSKLRRVINSFMTFRDQEEKRLKDNPDFRLGNVTTTNLNMMEGGVQPNVVPAELKVVFDIRITPTADMKKFEEQIVKWCADAGEGVTYKFLQKEMCQAMTPTTKDNPWWNTFSTVCDKLGLKLELEIFPAATDSRYLRDIGLPAIGFSPMNHTPILLHDHNEFLNEDIYLKGIDIYCEMLPALAELGPVAK